MDELIKLVGGVGWIIGAIFLFVSPLLGLVILAVAILATVASVSRTKERRHQELLAAQRNAKEPPPNV